MSIKEIGDAMRSQYYLGRTTSYTATEVQMRIKQMERTFQRDVVDPFMAPIINRMFNLLVEQGIVVANLHIPDLLWWEKVLCWNPCNNFVVPKLPVFRIEPDVFL